MADTGNEALREYEVVQAAVVLRVGRERDAVQRFVRGQVIRLRGDSEQVRTLVGAKAIRKADSDNPVPNTRQIVQSLGAPDDPAAALAPDSLPINTEEASPPNPSAAAGNTAPAGVVPAPAPTK